MHLTLRQLRTDGSRDRWLINASIIYWKFKPIVNRRIKLFHISTSTVWILFDSYQKKNNFIRIRSTTIQFEMVAQQASPLVVTCSTSICRNTVHIFFSCRYRICFVCIICPFLWFWRDVFCIIVHEINVWQPDRLEPYQSKPYHSANFKSFEVNIDNVRFTEPIRCTGIHVWLTTPCVWCAINNSASIRHGRYISHWRYFSGSTSNWIW